jgi:hypothetical protein
VRDKVKGGAAVHSRGKVGSKSPKEIRAMGHGRRHGLTPSAALRIPTWNEVLRSTRRGLASSGNRRQRRGANGERSAATDEVVRLGRGRNPGARILDVAAERNKSARYSEE